MPFVKNISLKRNKKIAQGGITISLAATATGSSGYFTSSNSVLYTGASVNTPSNITYTVVVAGGTPPYNIQWSASLAYSTGYSPGDNQSSITIPTYAGEQDTWTVRVSDATSNVSASINTIIFGDDPPSLNVSTLGSDTPAFQVNDIYGSTAMPLRTIDAAIRYAIPNETTIYVSSGTYTENPRISKSVIISGSSSPGLGSGNYFIYDTVWASRPTSSLAASRIVHGFTESSFATIGVTTSGSIQQAIYDVSSSGVVYPLAGVHIISSSIRLNQIHSGLVTINGVHVNTGSGTFPQDIVPTTILRTPNDQTVMFRAFNTGSTSAQFALSNLALETYPSSSYLMIDSGVFKNIYLEMVQFRTISSSVANTRYMNSITNNTSTWGSSNLTDSRITYAARNISTDARHPNPPGIGGSQFGPIFDAAEIGFGTGRVIYGPYAPFRTGYFNRTTGDMQRIEAHSYFDANHAEQTAVDVRTQRLSDCSRGTNRQLQNPATSTTRPFFRCFNNNLYNGLAYLDFGNDGATPNDYLQASRISTNSTSSINGMLVFSPYSLTQNRGVIYKIGDNNYGLTFAMTGSFLATTFYSRNSAQTVTASVCMLAPVSTGTYYLAELFFDSGSINKRVGMALYGTSSMITSSYFSSTEYPVSEWIVEGALGAVNNEIMGAAAGNYRVNNYIATPNLGTLADYYSGSIAGVYIRHQSSDYADVYAHRNRERKQLFDFLWMKFFPSSSYVSHSLISDT
jgi:hypothetical protein